LVTKFYEHFKKTFGQQPKVFGQREKKIIKSIAIVDQMTKIFWATPNFFR
jgi:hypothetical protein